MAWNRPNNKADFNEKRVGVSKNIPPRFGARLFISLLLIGCLLALYILLSNRQKTAFCQVDKFESNKNIKSDAVEETQKLRRYREEFNNKIAPFIKSSPTNITLVIGPNHLDPTDPDNALRTAVARDVATLLAIQPGESVPKVIPFSFMFEETAASMNAADGSSVFLSDGGNKRFLDEMAKWKVVVKGGDSEKRIRVKENLVQAQIELLDSIDAGLTVNDSLKAAYEFRVKAAAQRQSLVETISELHRDDPDIEVTKELVRKANEKLSEEGISTIEMCDIIEDYNEFEEGNHKHESDIAQEE